MTILDFATTTSSAARGISAVHLNDALWRVVRHDGEVVGYVERFTESRGIRYRAKRFIVRQQRFVPIGEFWQYDDALDCFRIG
ncbi:MAG: hypothetical protein JWM51_1058 [Microbacteriaceae bacterium]|jgi:hypothetical protein|nr:hypothetical protein [Microbacteriaceae bacterium]